VKSYISQSQFVQQESKRKIKHQRIDYNILVQVNKSLSGYIIRLIFRKDSDFEIYEQNFQVEKGKTNKIREYL